MYTSYSELIIIDNNEKNIKKLSYLTCQRRKLWIEHININSSLYRSEIQAKEAARQMSS